jgi:hypothetical protein
MIAVILGASAVYASEQSLPGDLLYPIKTKITEPIETALAITPQAKAEVETKFAERRLKEAEALDKMGRLTPKLDKEISKKFDSHVSDFYKIKKQIQKNDATSSIDENNQIQKDFENTINTHKEILNKFNRDNRGLEKTDTINSINSSQENVHTIKKLDNKNASSADSYKKPSFQEND